MKVISCFNCDESFSELNKSIICEFCNCLQCEKCSINSQPQPIEVRCSYCYRMPKNNKPIYIKLDECYVCMETPDQYSTVTLECGHVLCYKDYSIMAYSIDCDGRSKGLINKCGLCRSNVDVNRVVKGIFNPYYGMKDLELRIWKYNLVNVYNNIMSKLPNEVLDSVINEYRKFIRAKVELKDFNAELLSPSPLVDVVWHAHILMTKDYFSFCNTIAGEFIHHNINNSFDKEKKTERYLRTIDWLFEKYGYVSNVWLTQDEEVKNRFFKNVNSNEPLITLFVKSMYKTIELKVPQDAKIWQLKVMIKYKTNDEYDLDTTRLIYAGRNLNLNDSLQDCKISDNSTLHLIMRLTGC